MENAPLTNTVTYTNGKNWTRFTMTETSTEVRQASSTGFMVDISRSEALAKMQTLDGQRHWVRTQKVTRAFKPVVESN